MALEWMAGAGAGLGSILGFIGGERANAMNMREADHQRSWNEAMANKQHQWSLEDWQRQKDFAMEMWNLQNQYNSPVEQMARLKEAGLNPKLLYGMKGFAGNSAGQAPTPSVSTAHDVKGYSRAQVENTLRGINPFRDFVNFKQIQAQTDNLKALADLNRAKETTEATVNALKLEDVMEKRRGNLIGDTTLKETIEQIRLRTENLKQEERLRGLEINWKAETLADRIAQEALKADQMFYQNHKISSETKLIKLKNAWQEYENNMQRAGIRSTDDPFLRAMYADKDLRPYLKHAIFWDKGIDTVSKFLKFYGVFGKGKINKYEGKGSPSQTPKRKWTDPLPPNRNFLNK